MFGYQVVLLPLTRGLGGLLELLLPLLRGGPLHDGDWAAVEQDGGTVKIGACDVRMGIHPRPVPIVMEILPSIKTRYIGHVIVVG